MRALYLAEDRADIRYATEEAAIFMSEPITVAWEIETQRTLSCARPPIGTTARATTPVQLPFGIQRQRPHRMLEDETINLMCDAIPLATLLEDALCNAGADCVEQRRKRVVRFDPYGVGDLGHETSCARPWTPPWRATGRRRKRRSGDRSASRSRTDPTLGDNVFVAPEALDGEGAGPLPREGCRQPADFWAKHQDRVTMDKHVSYAGFVQKPGRNPAGPSSV